jgi:hypothetical protein
MAPDDQPTRTWEVIASAGLTVLATVAAIVSEDLTELASVVKRIPVPAWLLAIVEVPRPVWWALTALLGLLLFLLGRRLAPRWGTPALLMAPAIMLALQYAVPWLLYAPVRSALPGING